MKLTASNFFFCYNKQMAEYIIKELYKYYYQDKDNLPKEHLELYKNLDDPMLEDIISDYIAGMTDRYVIKKFKEIFVPEAWDKY